MTDGGQTYFNVDECTFTGDDAVCRNVTCNNIDGSFECICLVTEASHALVIQASKVKVMSAPIPLQDIFAHAQTA